jgi:hypothetical protein
MSSTCGFSREAYFTVTKTVVGQGRGKGYREGLFRSGMARVGVDIVFGPTS